MRVGLLIGTVSAGLLSAPALAADLGQVEPLPTPQYTEAAPANDWTGFYLGVLGGYGWGTAETNAVGDVDANGFDIGGYAGGNWQWGQFVVGVEADLLYPFRDGSAGGLTVEQGLNGSLRGRAGIALDRFLAYATAGGAATQLELSNAAGSDDAVLWGWTAGAGLEGMVRDNITARIEYRYTDYGDETFTPGGVPVTSDFSDHTIRGGVGFKF
ncbi:MAG: outer membrane protein [Propylenella sp.]